MGNRGTFTKSLRGIVTDFEFVYHMGYLVVSMMGMCVHEFFYSLLVSGCTCILFQNESQMGKKVQKFIFVKIFIRVGRAFLS